MAEANGDLSQRVWAFGFRFGQEVPRAPNPTPTSRPWAKLAVGKAYAQPPLPRLEEDVETGLAPLTAAQWEAQKAREIASRSKEEMNRVAEETAPPVRLAETLAGAHPLVRETAQYVERIPGIIARANKMRGRLALLPSREWPPSTTNGRYSFVHKNLLNVEATLSEMPWILRFHAALFKALGKRGATIGFVQGKEPYERSVEAELNGERIRFEFKDGYRRVRIPEKGLAARRDAGEYPGTYDYPPSGAGTLHVYGVDPASHHEWKGTRDVLEAKLGYIVQCCLDLLRDQPGQREQRRLARADAVRREQIEAKKREVATSRQEQLVAAFELAEQFAAVGRLTAYLAEVEAWIPTLAAPYDKRGIEWLKVVRHELDKKDPLQSWGARCLMPQSWREWPPAWWPENKLTNE